MIMIRISKDVRQFKPKFIGPFNKRQVIAIVIAFAVCGLIYSVAKSVLPQNVLMFLLVIIGVPIILLGGFVDIFGVPAYEFIVDAIKTAVLSPEVRKYETKNSFAGFAMQNVITEEYFTGRAKKKKTKKQAEKELKRFYKIHPDQMPIK